MLKLLLFGVGFVIVAGPIPSSCMESADFEFLKFLGKGLFAEVYAVKHIKTGHLYAMKVTNITKGHNARRRNVFGNYAQMLVRELKISTEVLNHFEGAVHVYGAFVEGGFAFLLMDYVSGGTLLDRLKSDMGLKWDQEDRYYYDLLNDDHVRQVLPRCLWLVTELHERKIVHGDLNLQNFFVTQNGTIILSDFTTAMNFSWMISIVRKVKGARQHQSNIDYERMRAEWRPVHDYNAEGDKMYDVMAVTDKNNVQGLRTHDFFKSVKWAAIDKNEYNDSQDDVNYAPHPFEPRARKVIEKDPNLKLSFHGSECTLRKKDKKTLRAFNYESPEEPRAL